MWNRYVKVIAKKVGPVPDWHIGSSHDGRTWIFIDEILSYKENGLDFISLWDELNVPVLCPEIGCGGYIVNKKCI